MQEMTADARARTDTLVGWFGRPALVCIAAMAYTAMFWGRSFDPWAAWLRAPGRAMLEGIRNATGLGSTWSWVVLSALLGLVAPLATSFAVGLNPSELRLGAGSRAGWRLAALAFVISLLPITALALHQGFQVRVLALLHAGVAAAMVRYSTLIVVEQCFVQGLVFRLALGPERDRASADRRLLASSLVAQAAVFAWIHVGRNPLELIGAFPAGLVLGYITWRARSVWPGIVLHAAFGFTAATIVRCLCPSERTLTWGW